MTRSFCYRTFVAGWRAACAAQGLNPATGTPIELEAVYRTDLSGRRCIVRVPILPDPDPEPLCDPAARDWWAQPSLWDNAGPNHSATEAAALASIAAQCRAALPKSQQSLFTDQHAQEVEYDKTSLHDLPLRAVHWREDLPIAIDPHTTPLRVLHELRGVEVAELAGVRMEVPIRPADRRKGKHWQRWYDYLKDEGMLRDEEDVA